MPSQTPSNSLSCAAESGAQAFVSAMLPAQRDALTLLRAQARQAVPVDCVTFLCGSQALGQLLPAHALQLAQALPNANRTAHTLLWHAEDASVPERSAQLQEAVCTLHAQGLIDGWRNEQFCFYADPALPPDPAQSGFVRIERAGFRYLGMMSHAVHINGFTPDGRMWCGQRSAHKATDPGLWDNMTAGGLSAGESLESCAVRELWEEAGLQGVIPGQLQAAGRIRISRITPSGWHDEMLHVYNLQLPFEFVPSNQDGEVQAFACLSATEILASIALGQWTHDAALALAQGVLFHPDI